ncbi:MAG: hypothetical protein A2Z32_04045 [Chloroflexi bacterium RBG_16_69_14]|nr:MAG: hypothetical protein A2Z32_04045 [Chloroflexi bacterium RBG_16_69_14]
MNVIGPPVTVEGWVPLVTQTMVNHEPVTATGSANEIERLAASATPVAPAAGEVTATVGAGSTVGRGVGAPVAKSAALSSVSVAPASARSAAIVFDRVGAAAAPSKQFAVP